MCGIFGTLNYKGPVNEQEIFQGLWHRGPDQQGAYHQDTVSLYHTRLSIQDLTASGRQPMFYKGLVIVFNGEIYNHMELRSKYGFEADSHSDTLTLLMLFEQIGIKMLEEFDGMFAFSLFDTINRKMYLARDRAGKKPLYVYQNGDTYVFSSELNTLYRLVRPEIDYPALADYLYLGHHYRKATPYLLVSELENGHYLEIDTLSGNAEDHCWFTISDHYQQENLLGYPDAIKELDVLLQKAVKRRIDSSDLDVGSFLSGGIDSGLVTAIAAGHTSKLKTFTVKIDGEFDESVLAGQVAQKYDTDHQVVEINFSTLTADIEKILTNHGEPNADNSAIPSYYVAEAAKKQITVVLNGDGADELFAGYRRYVPFKQIDFFNPGRLLKISSGMLAGILPVADQKQSLYTYIYRLLKFASYSDLTQMYCSASSDLFVGFEDVFFEKPLMKNLSADLAQISGYPVSALKKILLTDFEAMLFSRLLPKMDIATMAHSLEGRSPFLSKELLEFAPGLPDHYKIKNIQTKAILRDLAGKYLPPVLTTQPKRGFEIPLKSWVDHQLKEIMETYLLADDPLYARLIKRSFIEDLIAKKIRISEERRAKILFCVFSLEVWYKNL